MPERIKMYNADADRVAWLPDTKHWRDGGWAPVDPATLTTEEAIRRDLNAARRGDLNELPAADVVAALGNLPEDEREQVVATEKASAKPRKTVLNAD